MQEFVVPRSMPIVFAIAGNSRQGMADWPSLGEHFGAGSSFRPGLQKAGKTAKLSQSVKPRPAFSLCRLVKKMKVIEVKVTIKKIVKRSGSGSGPGSGRPGVAR